MIGTRLGQYRLEALLGQGGMGAVYLATDEMLGRQVAIKVLRDEGPEPGAAIERFKSEARILSRLDHPHILRLYGFSEHDGQLYMVTEYVKGEGLNRVLERAGAIPPAQVLEWADQVLEALHYAHDLGVVHRDIKPANILIDERNRARLLDFGVARLAGHDGLTRTGHAVGTLSYMAPEQVLDEDIDGRADVYAFGVVLCQLLIGRRPYRSATTAGLIREIIEGPPPDVLSLLPAEARCLGPSIARALARHRDDRPTAAQLRQELRAARGGSEVTVVDQDAVALPTDPDATVAVAPPLPAAVRPWQATWVLPAVVAAGCVGGAWYALSGRGSGDATAEIATSAAATPAPAPAPEALPASPDVSPSIPTTSTPGTPSSSSAPASTLGPAIPVTSRAAAAAARPEGQTPSSAPDTGDASGKAEPTDTAGPVADAAAVPAARGPSATFKGLLLVERIDGDDEEFDVSLRLDGQRAVVIDEDGVARKSVAYSAIARATYNTRKPRRFSPRRAPSHWLTLEVGTTPIVLRLNSKTYEQVLSTLSARGVRVVRLPDS